MVGEVFVSALTSDDDSVYTFTSSNPRLEEDTDWFYQTRRFGLEDRQIRINYIIIAYQGGPFRVEYKINDGPCTLLEVLPYSADLYTAWIPRQLGLVDLELIFRNSTGEYSVNRNSLVRNDLQSRVHTRTIRKKEREMPIGSAGASPTGVGTPSGRVGGGSGRANDTGIFGRVEDFFDNIDPLEVFQGIGSPIPPCTWRGDSRDYGRCFWEAWR